MQWFLFFILEKYLNVMQKWCIFFLAKRIGKISQVAKMFLKILRVMRVTCTTPKLPPLYVTKIIIFAKEKSWGVYLTSDAISCSEKIWMDWLFCRDIYCHIFRNLFLQQLAGTFYCNVVFVGIIYKVSTNYRDINLLFFNRNVFILKMSCQIPDLIDCWL